MKTDRIISNKQWDIKLVFQKYVCLRGVNTGLFQSVCQFGPKINVFFQYINIEIIIYAKRNKKQN